MSNVNGVNSYNSLEAFADRAKSTSNSELTTEGFFKLLAAQLQNQDMSNPMDNSEMMTQMTQIAMMQAMNNFSTAMGDFAQVNTINYGTSMMGKEVMVAVQEKNGSVKKITGTVTRVDIFGGVPTLYIDDDDKTGYPVSSIMSVYEKGHKPPEESGETGKDDEVKEPGTDNNTDGAEEPGTDNNVDGAGDPDTDNKTDASTD
ncbi:flagellar hook assembly protein FlgD [Lacrimispora sp.]|jgi:flagellar basal-body rod modification protein FlgD|uniref:flagellar hook assembly protein FlgD n=1 Tax=Lacrimispora sp. TaxID=2719234 RepID=UPI0028992560|nr:flagellar hook capping FlgD N-terminal domain-containing protein [Lacrimispora sp.]